MPTTFQKFIPIVLAGPTGSGKTEILHALQQMGEQVLDLEALAGTDGSVFSGLKYAAQPRSYDFHKALEKKFRQFTPAKPVYSEREAYRMGKRLLPKYLFEWLEKAPGIYIESGRRNRIERIYNTYVKNDPLLFMQTVLALQSKMSSLRFTQCFEHLRQNDFDRAIGILLDHYDQQPAYEKPVGQILQVLNTETVGMFEIARAIIQIGESSLLQQNTHINSTNDAGGGSIT